MLHGLWLDSFVRRVWLGRFVLEHWLGFRRGAPVRVIGLRRGVPGHWLGFRRGASVVAVIRERWEDRFANKPQMATPRNPSDYFVRASRRRHC